MTTDTAEGAGKRGAIGELTPLEAELLAALKEIATLGEHGMAPSYGEWLTFHDKIAQLARAAIARAETPPKGGE